MSGLVALGSAPPVSEALLFNFTGLFPLEKTDDAATFTAWDVLHERITAMYDTTIVK